MRILVVNWNDRENPHAGGAEIHLHELFGRIALWGHEIHLFASGWPGCTTRAVVDGLEVTRVGGRHSFAVHGRGAVRHALGQTRFDVVVEDINKIPLFLPTLTALPFVAIVPHLFGTTAFATPVPTGKCNWVGTNPGNAGAIYWRPLLLSSASEIRQAYVRLAKERHPGVDSRAYRPDPATPRATRPTFLYLGRLKRYKGVEFAIRALAAARTARPDMTLDICGQGDDRARLERLAVEHRVSDAVRFLGYVSEDEKRRLLRRAWAVVFPSPKEGWGITNVEAAASGTPALASDSPGLRESVQDGVTGYLVPHGDVQALADRMLALAADPALVDRLGRAARMFAEGLSWDSAARATLSHIEQTVAERERKR